MAKPFIEGWIEIEDANVETFVNWLEVMEISTALFEFNDKNNKNVFNSNSCNIINRKTIYSQFKNQGDLDVLRKKHDILVMYCTTPELTKWACQDQRIDGLLFPNESIHQLVDESTINLMQSNNKYLDLDMRELSKRKNPIGLMRNIKKALFKATNKQIPFIFSTHAVDPIQLRSKLSILGLANFFSVSNDYYNIYCIEWLLERIKRNLNRKNDNFVIPGVWLLNEGDE